MNLRRCSCAAILLAGTFAFGADLSDSVPAVAVDSAAVTEPVYIPTPLESAYSAYLDRSYELSLKQYRSIWESSSDQNALYGMINSLTMLKRYEEALLLCKTGHDPILRAKEAWAAGLAGSRSRAKSALTRPGELFSGPQKAVILRSGGDGFYGAGDFREAVKWYREAESTEKDSLTRAALASAEAAKKSAVIQTVTAMGGPILYSHDGISEQGNRYRYKSGSYFDIGSRWDIRKRTSAEFHYNRFDASFGLNRFGINRIFKSLDNSEGYPWPTQYSVHDSLEHWESDSQRNWYEIGSVTDTSYMSMQIADTAWLLYSDITDIDMAGSAFDTTVQFTPESIWQNSVYTGVTVRKIRGRSLDLGGSLSLFNSNMKNLSRGSSVMFSHSHGVKKLTLTGNWYGTFTEKTGTLQASPEISGSVKRFSWRLTPSYIWKMKAPAEMNVPGVQLSAEAELGFNGRHLILSGSSTAGKRAFAGESFGKNLVTISLPHRFTGSFYGAVLPGSGRVTIFTLLRYENYEQLSRLIALAGTAVTF